MQLHPLTPVSNGHLPVRASRKTLRITVQPGTLRPMTQTLPLPRALRANALASLVTGLAGLLMSAPLAQTIGLAAGTTYQVIGGILILHTLILMWASGRATIAWWIARNIAALAAYVLTLIALLIFSPIATPLGQTLLASDALLVTALALWQFRALNAAGPQPAQ